MWERRLGQGNVDLFENLTVFFEANELRQMTGLPCITEYITALRGHFHKYFSYQSGQYDWVINPFHATAPVGLGFSTGEEDQFIEMTSDSTLRLQFSSKTLGEF